MDFEEEGEDGEEGEGGEEGFEVYGEEEEDGLVRVMIRGVWSMTGFELVV